MKIASNILLKILGLLLLTAAILKGWQLINEPMANNSIWTNRSFLIFTVEFELVLSIWLLSGLFKKAAWLACLICFSLFSVITFYKAITGYASCGCFGSVHVNPWITLFAIDLPSVLALSIFHPRLSLRPLISFLHLKHKLYQETIKSIIVEFFHPLPKPEHFAIVFAIGVIILGITAPILALNKPAVATSRYEVLEPEKWIGKELPILENIDIKDALRKGNWFVLFYHYDCPDCQHAIQNLIEMLYQKSFSKAERYNNIVVINVPPYGLVPIGNSSLILLGKLNAEKKWLISTPVVILIDNKRVKKVWDKNNLNWDQILDTF